MREKDFFLPKTKLCKLNWDISHCHNTEKSSRMCKFSGQRWDLTSAGVILNASAILTYNSLTLENPSILPVGLPWASCVWNTSLGRWLAGGGGSPAPFAPDLFKVPAPACPPPTSSLSTKCSLVDLVFFLHGSHGILLLFSASFSTTWKEEK